MASALLAEAPDHWVQSARPFLQRAAELEGREPLAAYFLCTHVAFLCMQRRKKDDDSGNRYLMKLLDILEQEKRRLGAQLEGVDGRTVLTRLALILFTKADDEERSGQANLSIVRLFFTASVLFEATAQFTEDNQMDSVAKEKCVYAKFTAARMKKALDAGAFYQSRNKIEASPPLPPSGSNGGGLNGLQPPNSNSSTPQATPLASPPPPPYPAASGRQPPAYAPPASMQPIPPSSLPFGTNGAGNTETSPPLTSTSISSTNPNATVANPRHSSGKSGRGPSTEAIIDAQQYARQAVSALQFYDHETARKKLLEALQLLDQ